MGPFKHRGPRGLTLIELTVSLLIVAMLFAAVVSSVGAITGAKAKGAAGELGGVIRSLYDTAALTGKTCRLVFEMPGLKEESGETRYWAECAAGNVTTRRDRDEDLRDATRARDEKAKLSSNGRVPPPARSQSSRPGGFDELPTLQELMAQEHDRVDRQAQFQQFTNEEIQPRKFSSSVRLSVWTQHQRQAVKSGLAYLYFFPQGFTEKSMIFVRQGGNVWTITVAPLTGKTTVVGEELEVPRA